MKGAGILDFEKLREVIGDYQQLDFAKGAVELPLHCAEVADVDHQGQEYWNSVEDTSQPSSDPRKEFWDKRAQCYDLVLDTLEAFEQKAARQLENAENARIHAYELAFASSDEMFHCRLYEWHVGRGLADEVLEVGHAALSDDIVIWFIPKQMRPAYLEAYLQRDPPTVE